MAIEFNHTIVHAHDKMKSAKFITELFGLPEPEPMFGYFLVVRLSNGVSLDFLETTEKIEPQHYAFLVSEIEFDQIFERIKQKRITFWADPARKIAGEVNHHFGGRGVYFADPSDNFMEIITQPYNDDDGSSK